MCCSQDGLRRARDPKRDKKDLGMSCRLNLHLDASATVCLVNRRDWARRNTSTCKTSGYSSKSGRFTTKKVDTSVNPADPMTKPESKARIEQLMSFVGYEFVDKETSATKDQPTTTQGL